MRAPGKRTRRGTSPSPEGQRAVTLWRHEGCLRVEPAGAEVLRALRAVAHFGAQAPGGTYRVVAAPFLLGEVKADGDRPALYTRAVWEPAVRHALSAAGYRVEQVGRPPRPLPAPQLDRLARLGPVDHGLLRLVQQHEWGLVRYATGPVDPAWLVAQVALAWELKVVAVARRLDEVRQFARRLRAFLPAVTVLAGRGSPTAVGRVVVSTYEGLGNSAHQAFDIAWTDIVVALDAAEATLAVPMRWLSRAVRARVYGLLAADVKPAPLDRDHLTCLFGFAQAVVPRHGCHERVVQVAQLPVAGGAALPAGLGVVPLKRQGLWHHGLRNRLVARLARAARAGDHVRLRRLCPAAADALAWLPSANVLVLAEGAEHALALSRRLRGWPVLAGDAVFGRGLSREGRRLLRAGQVSWQPEEVFQVVTADALPDVALDRVDVLVRADGGVGLPPLRPEQLVQPDGDGRPLLLVDPSDRHHPLLRRWARERREAYAERGWFGVGVDPVQARVEAFLAGRPGGGLP
jgi:hypothetical protein